MQVQVPQFMRQYKPKSRALGVSGEFWINADPRRVEIAGAKYRVPQRIPAQRFTYVDSQADRAADRKCDFENGRVRRNFENVRGMVSDVRLSKLLDVVA